MTESSVQCGVLQYDILLLQGIDWKFPMTEAERGLLNPFESCLFCYWQVFLFLIQLWNRGRGMVVPSSNLKIPEVYVSVKSHLFEGIIYLIRSLPTAKLFNYLTSLCSVVLFFFLAKWNLFSEHLVIWLSL